MKPTQSFQTSVRFRCLLRDDVTRTGCFQLAPEWQTSDGDGLLKRVAAVHLEYYAGFDFVVDDVRVKTFQVTAVQLVVVGYWTME